MPWSYQNWAFDEPSKRTGYDCAQMDSEGKWFAELCDTEFQSFVCIDEPVKIRGNIETAFDGDSITNGSVHFWWNPSSEDKSNSTPSFQLDWQIENGSLPEVMELVSRNLTGSVTTPGPGSLTFLDYYKERVEYTAIVELPHNISDIIGDGALLVDIQIVPDGKREKS